MRGKGRILKSFTISGSELLVIFCCRVKTAIKHSRYHIKMSSLAGKILGNSSGSIAPGAETAGDNQPGGAPAPAPAPGSQSYHRSRPAAAVSAVWLVLPGISCRPAPCPALTLPWSQRRLLLSSARAALGALGQRAPARCRCC